MRAVNECDFTEGLGLVRVVGHSQSSGLVEFSCGQDVSSCFNSHGYIGVNRQFGD